MNHLETSPWTEEENPRCLTSCQGRHHQSDFFSVSSQDSSAHYFDITICNLKWLETESKEGKWRINLKIYSSKVEVEENCLCNEFAENRTLLIGQKFLFKMLFLLSANQFSLNFDLSKSIILKMSVRYIKADNSLLEFDSFWQIYEGKAIFLS